MNDMTIAVAQLDADISTLGSLMRPSKPPRAGTAWRPRLTHVVGTTLCTGCKE